MSYTETREDMMRSFNTIVKLGGSFKSPKQAAFLMKTCDHFGLSHSNPEYFIDELVLEEGQSFIVIDGEVRFADYGRRSIRRYGFGFVVDMYGVAKKFKLKFKHDANGCTYPDNKAAKEEFVRQEVSKELIEMFERAKEEKLEQKQDLKHVGEVGGKFECLLTVKHISESYGAYGITTCYHLNDSEGNKIVWFSSRNVGLEKDKEYNMTFTVKAHQTYKELPSTVITRAKVK